MKYNLLAAVMIICLSSCGTRKNMGKLSLGDRKWHLETLEGNKNGAFEDTTAFNISFVNDSTVTGTGACNHFFGRYMADNKGLINIEMGGSTQMACPNMHFEHDYFIALDRVNKYQIKDNTLTLLKGNEIIATFK